MVQLFQYYGRYQGFRSHWGGLPGWGKLIVGIFAIPGIVILLLSILLFLVSILALLLLALPVYRVLRQITVRPVETDVIVEDGFAEPIRPRKPVDVTIIEQ